MHRNQFNWMWPSDESSTDDRIRAAVAPWRKHPVYVSPEDRDILAAGVAAGAEAMRSEIVRFLKDGGIPNGPLIASMIAGMSLPK
jgi:hypothetical protein